MVSLYLVFWRKIKHIQDMQIKKAIYIQDNTIKFF